MLQTIHYLHLQLNIQRFMYIIYRNAIIGQGHFVRSLTVKSKE